MQLQKIDIDWDVHRLIESERRGFDEPPYVALRRLLNLPPVEAQEPVMESGIDWTEDGVRVPHGSDARMTYQRGRQVYEGRFLNGRLFVNGQSFDSLSAAASALAITKDGEPTTLNGWNYWEVRFLGETKWRSLKVMRDEAREALLGKLKIDL